MEKRQMMKSLAPDLHLLSLSEIVTKVRSLPMSSWLFKQLDDVYSQYFLRATNLTEFQNLREHLGYMVGIFIPMHNIDGREHREFEIRWGVLISLCKMKISLHEKAAESLTDDGRKLCKHVAAREHSEFGLMEPYPDSKPVIDDLIAKGLLERTPLLGRPWPLRPQDFTLQLTTLGRDIVAASVLP